jgi:hypothetical protein
VRRAEKLNPRIQALSGLADSASMGRVMVFVLLVAAGYWLVNTLGVSGLGPRVDGRQLVIETSDLELRFSRMGDLSESFMLFGGDNDQRKNSMTHVTLSGLAMPHVRTIQQSYPDFHKCNSPGAPQAQRLTKSMSLIGADRGAQSALVDAVNLYKKRVGGGGERTCVTLTGAQLELDSVRLKHDGTDITREVRPALSHNRFYVADDVEIPDCQLLLR